MAILDAANNAVVIRVVYDGAPLAGKTTSVGALGQGLGAAVVSPAEIGGRTLYFDWLDYTGGLFEGHRIRCQIVSAPGQASLAARRRRLLESADVVVFVGDSSPAGFEADHNYLGSLCSVLRQLNGVPVGVVLQANKRDLPDAVPVERMRTMLDGLGMKVGIIETVARDGLGIREAFVFAVRLALDRVRELMRLGQLGHGAPSINSADDLLNDLRDRERGALELAVEHGLTHTRLSDLRPSALAAEAFEQVVREQSRDATASDAASSVNGAASARSAPASSGATSLSGAAAPLALSPDSRARPPTLPSENVASGLVWPPVEGRVILQEVGRSDIPLTRADDGTWFGRVGERWQVRAPADAVFESVEQGRPALIELARALAAKCRADTVERCAVLAGDGAGRIRLWRIKRTGR